MADGVKRVAEAVPIKFSETGFGEAKLFFRDQVGGQAAIHTQILAPMAVGVQYCTLSLSATTRAVEALGGCVGESRAEARPTLAA
ncbi:MAG: hypothetical protein B7Z31_15815 [Rhodobacterales bacterium 12-65-15]|nr:MAG: hypothetical protein B7Z31_15815 [Rhodobacterales bacterium 12-65-15]